MYSASINEGASVCRNIEVQLPSQLLKKALIPTKKSRENFENPYANIPPQCYIETSGSAQNACLFCHTNAPARAKLGNNNPQAGLSSITGNLQETYAFVPLSNHSKSPSVNRWENIIEPQLLEAEFKKCGKDITADDTQNYLAQNNWKEGYKNRPVDQKEWDSGFTHPFRLFPSLDPLDLPAEKDGFVRSKKAKNGFFRDTNGYITGWRAINFMPYGIFTPNSGSVSGIYIRLNEKFMRDENGNFSLEVYEKNLDLVERSIQDRLSATETHYTGMAKDTNAHRGLFPIGTEFAHPLHYVDVKADGTQKGKIYPGTRANRVKEIRYMYKYRDFFPGSVAEKEENAPAYLNEYEAWIDNGAGWLLSAFIENRDGSLRPQSGEELLQCVGCHSDLYGMEPASFVSGTGNTIDSTWSMAKKFPGALGWREMDYLGYRYSAKVTGNVSSGTASLGDPVNKNSNKGEFELFLNYVVGASLFGEMPKLMEEFLSDKIKISRGYSSSWPQLDKTDELGLQNSQRLRLKLIREFTKKREYLDANGYIKGELLFPSLDGSLSNAVNYRKIVTTQRYTKGKDYFGEVPFAFRYYRSAQEAYARQNTKPYAFAQVVTDRPIDTAESITKGVGTTKTLIDTKKAYEQGGTFYGEYMPLLKYPLEFVAK